VIVRGAARGRSGRGVLQAASEPSSRCELRALHADVAAPWSARYMAKGDQRSNKMVKKPKKDTSAPKESSSVSTRPVAPVTTIAPKGKLKNK